MTESSEPRSRWVNRAARSAALTVVLVWLAWSASLLVYQEIVQQRYVIERPDRVLVWTPDETRSRRDPQRPYLNEDVLNSHVSFDSEYYLSIAVLGYDDPDVTQMFPDDGSAQLALNYAFMPAYPLAMRLVAAPLQALGLEPLAAASVAGVVVSLLAALVASLALFSIARRRLGDGAGIRAAFYLLVFPTGFFLAQVYTEAFFLALSLGCLALLDSRRPLLAGIAAVGATLTRPVGVLLAVPIAMTFIAGHLPAARRPRRAHRLRPDLDARQRPAAGDADRPVLLRLLGGVGGVSPRSAAAAGTNRGDQLRCARRPPPPARRSVAPPRAGSR